MATYTKGIDLYRAQRKYFKDRMLSAKEAHYALGQAGERDLEELLSGTLTPKQTRGAFARRPAASGSTVPGRRRELTKRQKVNRGLKGSVPLNPVNVQTGRLREGARLKRGVGAAAQTLDLVVEGVDYSKYVLAIGGTRYMVARNVQAELKRRFGPRNKAFFDTFVRRSSITQ